MDKLTLSVDAAVIASAKRYAKARRTSLSRLVENMLRMVASNPDAAGAARHASASPPVLARLRGSIKRGSVEDYRRHLERKYR
jgi:hypothetical protein